MYSCLVSTRQRHFGCSRPSNAARIHFWSNLKHSMYSFLVSARQRHFGCSRPSSAASLVNLKAQQYSCLVSARQHHVGCSRPSSAAFLVNLKAQHVFISGQREASPGIEFRPNGVSGLVRRPSIGKRNTQDGPCCGVY